jgi:hypothetical protein
MIWLRIALVFCDVRMSVLATIDFGLIHSKSEHGKASNEERRNKMMATSLRQWRNFPQCLPCSAQSSLRRILISCRSTPMPSVSVRSCWFDVGFCEMILGLSFLPPRQAAPTITTRDSSCRQSHVRSADDPFVEARGELR